jgi:hypothetical protein
LQEKVQGKGKTWEEMTAQVRSCPARKPAWED